MTRFVKLLRLIGPETYRTNAAEMLGLYHSINESGSGRITAEELASSIYRVEDPQYRLWVMDLVRGRQTQAVGPD